MEVGKTYRLSIEDYDMNGLGVAKLENIVIFVQKALKDEEVIAEITHIHKHYAFAETVRVINPSPDRMASTCPYYEGCGGCDLLHLRYKVECQIKENKVKNAFAKINHLKDININPIIPNRRITGYRNKIMLPFGYDEDENVIYGFYEKKTHQIVSIDRCEISNHYVNQVVEFIRRYISVMHIKLYDEVSQKGIFRGLMVRNNYQNEMMIVLITTKIIDFSGLIFYLKKDFPLVKSVYLNINSKNTNVMLGEEYHLLDGSQTLVEDILGLKFSVSPASFMQVNHDACENLYKEALRLADLNENSIVIDAYCGMGSITLNIAKQVKKVYGIEIVEDAIKNANYNKELNQISNAEFICGKCEDEIKKLSKLEKVDCIFFDPPRKGCEQSFLKTVVEMQIAKIIYISCNISTACRDIDYLIKYGYEVKEVTPVDLFSKTSHVETITTLVRVENRKD